MPTYDYECDACGYEMELFQSITEDPVKKCPKCKKRKLRRLFGTGAAIMFKGSGFYETDYRSESYKKDAAADKKKSESSKTDSSAKKSNAKSSSSKADSGSKPKKSE
ncbi:MAG: FmdB family zinc ribbon protein [Planctomycetota bacterium]|nr:FmdB family zinc ribbon protein [Planctomycetota bacterium]